MKYMYVIIELTEL